MKGQSGFTLAELLVVCVLLAIMSGILYGTINGILRGRALIESERDTARTAQYVLERMTRELGCRVPMPLSAREQESTRNSSFYFAGAMFEGIDRKTGLADGDQLRFIGLNTGQMFFNTVPNYGLVEIEYRLEEPEAKTTSLKGKTDSAGLVLVREEMPADLRNQDIIKQRKVAFPIAEDVVGLNFRYRKEGKWLSEWKEQASRLPEAVEVTLRLKGADERVDTYRTAVALSRNIRSQH
jgi:prepilin-type N-terminal cleavage/methylation domain-containing protein